MSYKVGDRVILNNGNLIIRKIRNSTLAIEQGAEEYRYITCNPQYYIVKELAGLSYASRNAIFGSPVQLYKLWDENTRTCFIKREDGISRYNTDNKHKKFIKKVNQC